LGAKIFINFEKYDFEECMRRLRLEIDSLISPNNTNDDDIDKIEIKPHQQLVETKIPVNNIDIKRPLPEAHSWNGALVKQWLEEKDIHTSIVNSILPCNGKLLYEIYMIKKEAPNYFYSSIIKEEEEEVPSFRDMAIFSHELRQLFE
jgi:hypothetical protein